jgi:hypothetical protein
MTASAHLPMNPKSTSLLHNTAAPSRARGFRGFGNKGDAEHGRLLFQRADEAAASGVYYPETLKLMRMAFDLAWRHVFSMFEDQERARQILAVQILHHIDRGEHNAGRLATSAADDLIALAGGASDRAYSSSRSTSAKAYTKRSFADYRALRQAT